jgi:aspartyl-tRNA(Asn)/glutamyl-tRNA(Gln) amidotransferase subunit A
MLNIKDFTISKAHELLKKGEITSVELVSACLKNIEEKNSELNVFLEVFEDALEQARRADEIIKNYSLNSKDGSSKNFSKLLGIPIAIKDNILIEGRKVSAASKMLENYVATYDAFAIKKLKEAGAILIGRTNMDEFAMGSSTENSAYGPVKNPIDPSRVPGGSSGGSAAALAANMALGALGSDTGGSVRQPASFCGLVGMKPSYGVISRSGLIAMASSLDQISVFAKDSEDASIIFETIVGKDEMDSTSVNLDPKSKSDSALGDQGQALTQENKKAIGIPSSYLKEGIDSEVLKNFEETVEKLKKSGYEIKEIDLPSLKYSLAIYYIIMSAEVSTNLSRLDGMRYGLHRDGKSVFEDLKKSRAEGFGPETRRRIILGTYVLSHGYYDAYYNKAWNLRLALKEEFENVFKQVDFVMTPTTPSPAFKFGEKADPLQMYLSDIFTVPPNLAGLPAISVPSGFSSLGLPLSVQFIGRQFSDKSLFTLENNLS